MSIILQRSVILLFMLCTIWANGTSKLDSLKNNYSHDKAKLVYRSIMKLGKEHQDSAQNLLKKLLPILDQGDDSLSYQCKYGVALLEYKKGKYENSFQLAKDLLSDIPKGTYHAIRGITSNQMGVCKVKLGEYEEAILNLESAKNSFEQINDLKRLAGININIGLIFDNTYNTAKAIEYKKKGVYIYKQLKDTLPLAHAYFNVAVTYFNDTKIEKAKIYLDSAQQLMPSISNPRFKGVIYNGISKILFVGKEYDRAMEASLKSLAINKKINKAGLIDNYENIGDIYMALNQSSKSEKNYLKAMDIAKELNNMDKIGYMASNLAKLYASQNQHKKAFEYLSMEGDIKDSIASKNIIKQVAELETKYETEKKEKENLIQKAKLIEKDKKIKQNIIVFSAISAALIFLLFLGYFAYRNVNQKRKIKDAELQGLKQEQETKLLESVLEGEERERNRLGKELHDGVNGMLAVLKLKLEDLKPKSGENEKLNNTLELLNSTSNEVRSISHNLLPKNIIEYGLVESVKDLCNQITSSGQINIEYSFIHMEERLKKSVALSIYRIIQELLSNILKHAEATETFIQISRNQNMLQISVEDNGRGFENSKNLKKGVGLDNIENRLKSINGKLDVDSEVKMGTTIVIDIVLDK